MQPNTETLTFKIGLSGTYWDKKPAYSVLIDGVEQAAGIISSDNDTVEYKEFTANLVDDQQHTLSVRLNNKTNDDTIQNDDKTEIVKDMLLNICSVEIEGLELGQMKWDSSVFVADDYERPTMTGCVNLGWNGTYSITFSCPFYLWLLENM